MTISAIPTFRMRVDQLVYTSRRKLMRKKKGNMKMEKNTSPGASTLSLSIAGRRRPKYRSPSYIEKFLRFGIAN